MSIWKSVFSIVCILFFMYKSDRSLSSAMDFKAAVFILQTRRQGSEDLFRTLLQLLKTYFLLLRIFLDLKKFSTLLTVSASYLIRKDSTVKMRRLLRALSRGLCSYLKLAMFLESSSGSASTGGDESLETPLSLMLWTLVENLERQSKLRKWSTRLLVK